MTGPSSIQGAQVIRLKKANCTVVAHSQVRDRNSAQPSAMSCHRVRRAAWFAAPAAARAMAGTATDAAGTRIRLSASTLTA